MKARYIRKKVETYSCEQRELQEECKDIRNFKISDSRNCISSGLSDSLSSGYQLICRFNLYGK